MLVKEKEFDMNLVTKIQEIIQNLLNKKKSSSLKKITLSTVSKKVKINQPINYSNDNILVLPLKSPHILNKFVEENRSLVYKYILKMLSKAIKKKMEKIDLFRLGDTPFIAKIEKQNYVNTLNDLLSHFASSSVEEYELANRCKKLIQKHQNNLLLEETKGT